MNRTDDRIEGSAASDLSRSLILSERDLEDAKRLLRLLSPKPTANCDGDKPDRARIVREARTIVQARRNRAKYFGRAMFGEPAWDMLLILYAFEDGERFTISRLAESSDAARATALRWIEYLLKERLIARMPHPTDKRAFFVELADKGRQSVEAYISTLIGSNLS